jgi:hypothetical protein
LQAETNALSLVPLLPFLLPRAIRRSQPANAAAPAGKRSLVRDEEANEGLMTV